MRLFRPRYWLFCAIATALPARPAAFGADDLAAVLSRIDKASAMFKGLTADVRKLAHTAVINEDDTDIGTIAVKRPKLSDLRVLFDIREPDPKKVAFEDSKGQFYYPKRNEVEIYNVGKIKGLVEQFLLLGVGSSARDLEGAYSIKWGGPETVAGQPATRIELTPKSKEMLAHYNRVDLWISDTTGLAVQQKLFAPGGDYILATYTNMKTYDNLSDSAVKLNLPKDVKKIQR